jgi:hypothetical protein
VHADLDTLVIALYVRIDERFGPRRGPGRRPKLSDAELVCLAVAQVLLGFGSERRWLRFAGRSWVICSRICPPPRPTTGACAGLGRWSPWPSRTSPPTPQAGVTSCGWSTRPHCRARPPVRRSAVRPWPGSPATAIARATTATSGAFGCMSWPVPTASRSPGAWPPQAGRARGRGRPVGPRTRPAAPGTGHLGRQGVRRP